MSSIGYYRYKVIPSEVGNSEVKLFINGSLASTATIVAKEFCDNFRIVKYLDSSGRYRFFPFNSKWEQKDSIKELGRVNRFVESIETSQGDSESLGHSVSRSLSLVAEQVSSDELDKLAEIYHSPRVYLYVGNGITDLTSDWVIVKVKGDNIGRRRSNNFSKAVIEIIIPTYHAVTAV